MRTCANANKCTSKNRMCDGSQWISEGKLKSMRCAKRKSYERRKRKKKNKDTLKESNKLFHYVEIKLITLHLPFGIVSGQRTFSASCVHRNNLSEMFVHLKFQLNRLSVMHDKRIFISHRKLTIRNSFPPLSCLFFNFVDARTVA